jgi:lipopolysaccharide/colanic/teichoic acid biosynthesis glycosyltransferase
MAPDAELRRADLSHLNEVRGPVFKITNDPRITKVGRFLRRTSLDELPQLLNVFGGDMSLVGPRPPLPSEVEGYDLWHRRRLSMKPGITGLWQVRDRHAEDFDTWVEADLEYIDRWSLWLDVKILLRTLPAAVNGR